MCMISGSVLTESEWRARRQRAAGAGGVVWRRRRRQRSRLKQCCNCYAQDPSLERRQQPWSRQHCVVLSVIGGEENDVVAVVAREATSAGSSNSRSRFAVAASNAWEAVGSCGCLAAAVNVASVETVVDARGEQRCSGCERGGRRRTRYLFFSLKV